VTLKRSPMKHRHRSTGPSPDVVEKVWVRDDGRCARCGLGIWGEREFNWSVGHRRPRRAGGDRRPETNLPANLILLHGSATTLCHNEVESLRAHAGVIGFILGATTIPSQERIHHAVHGWCLLDDEGGWTPCASF
jgi:hypothetical protein